MWLRVVIWRLVVIAAIITLWEAAPYAGWVSPLDFPPFSVVIATLWDLLQDARFITNALITVGRILFAFAITAPLAVAAGIFIAERKRLDRAFSPLLQFAIAIPQSIFLPLFLLIFGIGFTEKVVFGATHIVFIVLVNTIAAFRMVPDGYLSLARSIGAGPAQIYLRFYLPAMLPYMMTGLRLGLILDTHAVLLAEMYGSHDGLGRQIFAWTEAMHTSRTLAAILLIASCTILINELMRTVEVRLGRWRQTTIAR
jgi:NitT/TauT family transport system permease protein